MAKSSNASNSTKSRSTNKSKSENESWYFKKADQILSGLPDGGITDKTFPQPEIHKYHNIKESVALTLQYFVLQTKLALDLKDEQDDLKPKEFRNSLIKVKNIPEVMETRKMKFLESYLTEKEQPRDSQQKSSSGSNTYAQRSNSLHINRDLTASNKLSNKSGPEKFNQI